MPITSNAYIPATWVNNSSPAIDDSELQAMSNAIKASQAYGTCSTAAATTGKTVSITGVNALYKGAVIGVQFTNGNSATNPTLQVNSLTSGAILCNGANVKGNMITPNMVALLQWDGSYFHLLNPASYVVTATLASASWSGNATTGWTQAVTISGLSTNNKVDVTPVYSSTLSTAKTQKSAWSSVDDATISTNTLTFRCFYGAPATNIDIEIEVS